MDEDTVAVNLWLVSIFSLVLDGDNNSGEAMLMIKKQRLREDTKLCLLFAFFDERLQPRTTTSHGSFTAQGYGQSSEHRALSTCMVKTFIYERVEAMRAL